MNPISLNTNGSSAALLARQITDLQGMGKAAGQGQSSPEEIKKAASQFESIILRQLLAPSIEPMMNSGMGGVGGSGGNVYGYMLTDTLASSLSAGGGLGLARMLERQFGAEEAGPTETLNNNKNL